MIINIPKQALVNRIIPKDRFNFQDATKINRIRWLGKLAPTTINLPAKTIPEIQIFSVEMPEFDEKVITRILDKVPQVILFIVNDELAAMSYGNHVIMKKMAVSLKIRGITLDDVRDNFVRQLLDLSDLSQPLAQQITQVREIQRLQSEINKLNQQITRTVQPNKRQALARKRYEFEQELRRLTN
ncbi:MAG: DUF4391 domain-containing protein [Liquorilactobacillus hordei]|uniref:DUF4391 domain-containing protein n=1 Tax=Liquorilactobacillus hordei TaxID=468911 RepID=UPI0039E78546